MMLDGELRAEVRDDTLYLDYTVVNGGERPVILGGRLPRNALHTSLTPDGTLLVRRPLGTPARELAPGATHEESLELPLPVPPRHPIAPQPEGPRHDVHAVSLQLDYVAGEPFIATLGPASATIETTIAG
jgi:hypothetical protein